MVLLLVCTGCALLILYLCIVRFILFIFSIYLFSLNAMPCSDGDAELGLETRVSMDMEHSHNGVDLCSPFCACHCCHVHNIDFGMASVQIVPIEFFKEIPIYFDGTGIKHEHSLLRPPRA